MRTRNLLWTALSAVALVCWMPFAANAQFGGAGAVETLGFTPGVDMPYFGVYNYVYPDFDAPSTFSDATRRTQIVQVRMEGTFDSMNPTAFPEITGAIMVPVGSAPFPGLYPGPNAGPAPAHTDVRITRNFGREVYNDLAILWNLPGQADVQGNTQYDLYIFVQWPDGWGQANRNVWYNAGNTALRVRYTIDP